MRRVGDGMVVLAALVFVIGGVVALWEIALGNRSTAVGWSALVLSAGLLACLALLVPGSHRWREALEIKPETGSRAGWRLALLATGVAVTSALVMVPSGRFLFDDYAFLDITAKSTWDIEPMLRLLSVTARFHLLVNRELGVWPFVVHNLLTLLAFGGVWALLLLRVGLNTAAALLAGAIVTMGPGSYYLMRWGTGFEHLGTYTLVLGCLYILDLALRPKLEARRVAGLLALAACLAFGGVFMKFQVVVILPASAAIWAWLVVPEGNVRKALGVLLLFGVAVGVPLKLSLQSSDASVDIRAASLGPVGSNLALAVEHWNNAYGRHLLLLGLMALVALVSNRAAIRTWLSKRGFRRWVSSTARSCRHDRGPRLVWAALLLCGLWVAPFALNPNYFPFYYPLLMSVPLTALIAAGIVRLLAYVPARWPLFLGAALCLLPVEEMRRNLRALDATESFQDGVVHEHGFTRWNARLREATSGWPAPAVFLVRARCPEAPELEAASWADLEAYERIGLNGRAVLWETGWKGTDVVFERPPPDTERKPVPAGRQYRLDYCRDHRLSLVDVG